MVSLCSCSMMSQIREPASGYGYQLYELAPSNLHPHPVIKTTIRFLKDIEVAPAQVYVYFDKGDVVEYDADYRTEYACKLEFKVNESEGRFIGKDQSFKVIKAEQTLNEKFCANGKCYDQITDLYLDSNDIKKITCKVFYNSENAATANFLNGASLKFFRDNTYKALEVKIISNPVSELQTQPIQNNKQIIEESSDRPV